MNHDGTANKVSHGMGFHFGYEIPIAYVEKFIDSSVVFP